MTVSDILGLKRKKKQNDKNATKTTVRKKIVKEKIKQKKSKKLVPKIKKSKHTRKVKIQIIVNKEIPAYLKLPDGLFCQNDCANWKKYHCNIACDGTNTHCRFQLNKFAEKK